MKLVNISLSPAIEKLVEQKVHSGEFGKPEEVIEAALRTLFNGAGEVRESMHTSEEWMRTWDDFMAEVERDIPPGAPVLSEEALSRECIYDDQRHRI